MNTADIASRFIRAAEIDRSTREHVGPKRAGRPAKDMMGLRCGRLTVISRSLMEPDGNVLWRCRCECGIETDVRGSRLRGGSTGSCGCLRRERSSQRMKARQTTHGLYRTPEYISWIAMIQRCTNEKATNFASYGGAGVTVCDRWRESFQAFFDDMGPRPRGTSLDRFPDFAGNYEPGNVRWATKTQQAQNRSVAIWVDLEGERLPIKDACDRLGADYHKALGRIGRGWSPLEAIGVKARKPWTRNK